MATVAAEEATTLLRHSSNVGPRDHCVDGAGTGSEEVNIYLWVIPEKAS